MATFVDSIESPALKKSPVQNPLLRVVRDMANLGNPDAITIALHLSDEDNERLP